MLLDGVCGFPYILQHWRRYKDGKNNKNIDDMLDRAQSGPLKKLKIK